MTDPYTRAPHRRDEPQGTSPNAALMIDFDNVTMAMRSNLGQELRNFLNSDIIRGKVSVQRAYADWRRYPQYIVPLAEASIDLIFAPAYGSSKKNATDIRLAIDALEIVFTRPEIGTFILLSGDSDFSSLVLKLKEYGKYVIGVGLQESTSDLLVQNCDEYYSYNSLSGLTSAEELETERKDPWELVEAAVRRMEERDDVMRSDRLKQVMLEIDASFDEKDHGFSKFNRFLADAASRGLIRLRKMGDGQYEVAPVESRKERGEEPRAEKSGREDGGRASGRQRRGRRERRDRQKERPTPPPDIETSSLRAAYDLLREVVEELTDDQPVRDSEVKREMLRRNQSFDEGALGFSKFSRFLRQARDEEVVDLETDADGNYHVSPPGSGVTIGGGEPEGRRRAEERGAEEKGRERRESAEQRSEPRPEEREAPEAGREAAEREEPSAEEREPGREAPSEQAPEAEESRSRRRGGLGRFRRGSRSNAAPAGTSKKESAPAPGPVDEPSGEGEKESGGGREEAAASGASATASEDSGGRRARSTLSRFRRGQKAGGEGADEGGPKPDEEDEERQQEAQQQAAPVPEGAGSDAVEHMVSSWPGVGRKTAEKLVEAFGDEVFRVIDEQPDRLTDVLPEHRAHAVEEARQAERERVGS